MAKNIKNVGGKKVFKEGVLDKKYVKESTKLVKESLLNTSIVQDDLPEAGKKRQVKEKPLTRNKIASMLNSGISPENIALALGVSKTTIYDVKKQLDTDQLIEADADELVRLYPHALSKNVIMSFENELAEQMKQNLGVLNRYMMSPEKLSEASTKDLAIASQILFNSLRLCTNRSTENKETVHKFDKLLNSVTEDDILDIKSDIIDADIKND